MAPLGLLGHSMCFLQLVRQYLLIFHIIPLHIISAIVAKKIKIKATLVFSYSGSSINFRVGPGPPHRTLQQPPNPVPLLERMQIHVPFVK